jgi:hypothetical protein
VIDWYHRKGAWVLGAGAAMSLLAACVLAFTQ